MRTYEVKKSDWQRYFDTFTTYTQGKQVGIEIISLDLGDQPEEELLALEGISYDPKSDQCFVHTRQVDHAIINPLRVMAEEQGGYVCALEVLDGSDTKHLIRIRDPLFLPSHNFEVVEKTG